MVIAERSLVVLDMMRLAVWVMVVATWVRFAIEDVDPS